MTFAATGYVKHSAPVGECSKRILVSHVRDLCSPANEGDIQHFPCTWFPFF
jgi:hypothetical protein